MSEPVAELFQKPEPELPVRRSEPSKSESFLVKLADIDASDRCRKDHGDIMEMVSCINHLGLLNPPVVRRIEGTEKFKLVNGGRRYAAMIMMGWTQCFCTLKADFEGNDLISAEAELYENESRKDYNELERCENVKKIHDIKIRIYGEGGSGSKVGWTVAKTAAFVGESDGSNTSKRLKIAAYLEKHPEEKAGLQNLNVHTMTRKIRQKQHAKVIHEKIDSGQMEIKSSILLGDALTLIKELKDESQHLILTDPPFGLSEIDNMLGGTKGPSSTYTALVGETDNQTLPAVLELMDKLLPELLRVLWPSGHVYMFSSGQLLIHLIPKMQAVGFLVNENVLIWDKQKTTGSFKGLEYPSAYEPIIFGHKPPREKHLTDPTSSNILRFPPLHTSKKVHRFQKPNDLIAHLIRNSSRPGDFILDPFAGSGCVVRVAQELKRNALGFELDPDNWARAQIVLASGTVDAAKLLEGE